MNNDIFCYKKRFLIVVLLFSYAYMHLRLTGFISAISLDDFIHFSSPLPFSQRLLVPALTRLLASILPIELDNLFFLMDFLFISLTFIALLKLLREEFTKNKAEFLSILYILLLPLVTIINYRYTRGGEAAIFYPYDTASLFFMSIGFYYCLKEKWLLFWSVLIIATINRETSILLVGLIPILHWKTLKKVFMPLFLAVLIYLVTRLIIFSFLPEKNGVLMEWYFQNTGFTHFEMNMRWLLNEQNIFLFIFSFACLPLFWFCFYDYIPERYKPLRYLALVYFLMLLLVGNCMEARIFSEITILLYFPLCLAITSWLQGNPIENPANSILSFLNRYIVLATLFVVIIFWQSLNKALLWLLSA